MCGIAGFCNLIWDRKQVILQMNEKMLQRGPDAGGYFTDDKTGLTLGHRRLSIVDLSKKGAQPMYSHNERYVLVYNGEIYNAAVLKDKLLKEGLVSSFNGTSDTEIMLEAFCAYGVEETLKQCTGMFAIALYDRQEKTITLARDRVGEKPLYYGHVNGTFVFGSDLAAIKAIPDFSAPLSAKALKGYLRYGYVPAPLSIYEGIFKCRPGHILKSEYPYTEFCDTVYYDLKEEYRKGKEQPFTGTFTEAVDGLEKVLKNAVKSQMMADVPLGAFLSGGIDSSVIVSLMQSMSREKIKTFTIGFEDPKYNEAQEARAIAAHLGTEHTSLTISEDTLRECIPKIPDIFSEPFADSSQIPTYLVSRLAKEKVTVSLSGDAGDELFCGYNTYWKVASLYRKLEKYPRGLRKAAGEMLLLPPFQNKNTLYRGGHCLRAESIAGVHEAVCYDTTAFADRLLTVDRKTDCENKKDSGGGKEWKQPLLLFSQLENKTADIEDEMMLRDLLTYHVDDILVKVDRAGMAVSLENRVPMLDKEVLQYACSLPVSYKYAMVDSKPVSKYVLKELLYRYVPKELMERPKKGFSVPLTKWLTTGSVHEWAQELIEHSTLAADGILDGKEMQKLWQHFIRTGENKGLLWNVIVLEQWYRKEKSL